MSSEKVEIPSIAKTLFYGEVHEEYLFPFPTLSADQKVTVTEMIDAIQGFGESIDKRHIDEVGEISKEIKKTVGELGLCGLAVPEKFGGLELDYSLYSRIFGEISAIDASIATMLGAHQSIGFRALLNEGTEAQKAKWLPRLASGEIFAAFCLTEPGSGSDAYSIKTKAVRNSNGTFTITGQKLWITNAGLAEFYTVFAKTDHIDNGKKTEKISCFIVEKSMPGVSFGEKEQKMGIKASETRAVYLDKVVVPEENIIGELGKGFKIAMNILNTGRLSIGSGAVGGIRALLKLSTNHAKNRKQFGKPIADFALIQEKLARMASLGYATECMTYMTTGKMSEGMKDYSVESAMCKIYGSEALWQSVDMAMQIAGGNGYMKEYPYELYMRDSRINLIFEGTNEIIRVFIALSGISGPSEDLKALGKIADVSKAISDPIKSLGVLTDFAKKRMKKIISTKSLTKCHKDLEPIAEKFTSMLSDFAIKVENIILKYGKNIIGTELPQKRLAEMSTDLYAMICLLSRTTSILNNPEVSDAKKEYVKSLCKLAFQESRDRYVYNAKKLSINNDTDIKIASSYMVEAEGYDLDIINY
ncbi:MAG: acyl-CoA dehydrogenase family protein [Bacteriovoracaceae bacterium]